jgi:H-NS histone family
VEWEYQKIYLNGHGRRGDDIELLCNAGAAGWELVAVTPNCVAYLKRATSKGDAATERQSKYRNPTTSEIWSGRGRMPLWLKRKQDAGEDIDKYRIDE